VKKKLFLSKKNNYVCECVYEKERGGRGGRERGGEREREREFF